MKIVHYRYILLFLFMMLGSNYQVQCQAITSDQDSAVVQPLKAKVPIYKVGKWSKPGKAALMSAIVPGLGQAYNKSYWKIPVTYVGGTAIGLYSHYNHKQYLRFRKAYELRTDNLDSTVDEFVVKYPNAEALIRGRNGYHRRRDYTFLYSFLFYGINVTEAYVFAHLKGFDISDDLTMWVQPNILTTQNNNAVPAFSLNFSLKK